MAGDRRSPVRVRHQHRPRHVGGPAPQLTVDEIAQAAEEQPESWQWHGEIEYIPDITPALTREQQRRDDDAEHSAVKGHAAFPDLEWIEPVAAPHRQSVEKHVTDASAENYAQHGVEQQVVDIRGLPARAAPRRTTPRQP